MSSILHKDLLFYDIEVFEKYYCFCFTSDGENFQSVRGWVNTEDETIENKKKLLLIVKDKTLVGYNNFHYDDVMLEMFLKTKTTKGVSFLKFYNDQIIINKQNIEINYLFFNSLDVSEEIAPNMISLKKLEANQGINIEESTVDFQTTRELTETEKEEVDEYCKYDVIQCRNLFFMEERQNYFTQKEYIIDNFFQNKDKFEYIHKKTTWLVAELFDIFNLKEPSNTFINDLNVPDKIKKQWRLAYGRDDYKMTDERASVIEFDNELMFKKGGLHSSNYRYYFEKTSTNEILQYIDVASMYPSIIINFNLLGKKTKLYKEIYLNRLKAKKNGDITTSNALKLILNKLYGMLGAVGKEKLSNFVCFQGQNAIYTISKQLYPVVDKIMQINTDSVLVKYDRSKQNKIRQIVADWEQQFNLKMDFEDADSIFQMNVNNYITVLNNETKAKGFPARFKNPIHKSRDFGIVYKACVEKLMNDIPIYQTIINEKDPIMFQYIASLSPRYGKLVDENHKEYGLKVNRCFVTKSGTKSVKKKKDDENASNFADLPENTLTIHNNDVSEFDMSDLDYNFYIQLAECKLNTWMSSIDKRKEKCLKMRYM